MCVLDQVLIHFFSPEVSGYPRMNVRIALAITNYLHVSHLKSLDKAHTRFSPEVCQEGKIVGLFLLRIYTFSRSLFTMYLHISHLKSLDKPHSDDFFRTLLYRACYMYVCVCVCMHACM